MAGHQPHPRCSTPREPPARPLRPSAPREPLAGPLRPSAPHAPRAPREPQATPATLRASPAGPHRAKPQERPPVRVGRTKCPTNKNNNKIYQMRSNKVIMNEDTCKYKLSKPLPQTT
jgi:hypothetical protein